MDCIPQGLLCQGHSVPASPLAPWETGLPPLCHMYATQLLSQLCMQSDPPPLTVWAAGLLFPAEAEYKEHGPLPECPPATSSHHQKKGQEAEAGIERESPETPAAVTARAMGRMVTG